MLVDAGNIEIDKDLNAVIGSCLSASGEAGKLLKSCKRSSKFFIIVKVKMCAQQVMQ